eukprot:PITA_21367
MGCGWRYWTRSVFSPRSIEEAYKCALKAEEKINRRQNARRGRGFRRGRGQSYGRGRTASNNDEGNSLKAAGSTEKDGNTRGGMPYHDQAAQRGAYVAQPEETEVPPQEVENMPETGEALVLNKFLLKPDKESANPTWWKSLFQTVCKSQGKCCKLIIDSGSMDNLVATEMCEVEFHIGKYKDKVTCDIMPMDVCHILLGRPWQYDRKVVHNGKTNCYNFMKDGVKHTLYPRKKKLQQKVVD